MGFDAAAAARYHAAMNGAVDRHCAEIDRCNQRGGRMLSIVDLLDAETVTRELADYLLAAIGSGASFLVGARPGGAGKTTVMGALLNFVPPDVDLVPAVDSTVIEAGIRSPEPRRCYVCHEIGWGVYYAYLWGPSLRAYFGLPAAGHMLATNLHADTLEEAEDQIVRQNHVPLEAFRKIHLALFLEVKGGWQGRRALVAAWESDGSSPHRRVYMRGKPNVTGSRLVAPDAIRQAHARLQRVLDSGARSIREVRSALVCG